MDFEQHRQGIPHWVIETKLTAPQMRACVADRPHRALPAHSQCGAGWLRAYAGHGESVTQQAMQALTGKRA